MLGWKQVSDEISHFSTFGHPRCLTSLQKALGFWKATFRSALMCLWSCQLHLAKLPSGKVVSLSLPASYVSMEGLWLQDLGLYLASYQGFTRAVNHGFASSYLLAWLGIRKALDGPGAKVWHYWYAWCKPGWLEGWSWVTLGLLVQMVSENHHIIVLYYQNTNKIEQ